jgi:hypothetical protein
MRRIRISTWVLAVVFVAALIVYILVKPSSAASTCTQRSQPAAPTTSAPALPGVPTGSPPPSPSGSPSCG